MRSLLVPDFLVGNIVLVIGMIVVTVLLTVYTRERSNYSCGERIM